MSTDNRFQISLRTLVITSLASFVLGSIFVFALNIYISKPVKKDEFSFIPIEKSQLKIKDGGVASRGESETFTKAFYSYLWSKEPIESEFNKKFTAATWYSMSELENFFKVIKDNTGLNSTQIRVYVCPAVYPANTINPFNQKDVSGRFSTTLAFFQAPYNVFKQDTKELYLKGNANCLGLYNWGDLEP